ncbi:MAG: hypothetical protein DRO65_03370 [Candidatus Altiarchaeales archaeon]|nr:MAG: hypothetical protein DRO65_03370 [Candidatus Altiarchaeales archaeon]
MKRILLMFLTLITILIMNSDALILPISILNITRSPVIQYPEDVEPRLKSSDIVDISGILERDGSILVTQEDVFKLRFSPKPILPESVEISKGVGFGSVDDLRDDDNSFYVITAENSSGKFIIDAIFEFKTNLQKQYSIKDFRVVLIGKFSQAVSEGSLQILTSDSWKKIADFTNSIKSKRDVVLDGSYASSGNLKLKIHAENDGDFSLYIDELRVYLRKKPTDFRYELPRNSKIIDIGDCCDPDIEVDYNILNNKTLHIDLSDYLSFSNKEMVLKLRYYYLITLKNIRVEKVNATHILSNNSKATLVESFNLESPFLGDYTISAKIPDEFSGKIEFLSINACGNETNFEIKNGSVLFSLKNVEDCEVKINFVIKGLKFLKPVKEMENVLEPSDRAIWLSSYVLNISSGETVKNLTIGIPTVANETLTLLNISIIPEIPHTTERSGDILLINFPEVYSPINITIKEYSRKPMIKFKGIRQYSAMIVQGEKPQFSILLEIVNPFNREASINLSEVEIASRFNLSEDVIAYIKSRKNFSLILNLKPQEKVLVPIYFFSKPVLVKESSAKQISFSADEPVSWLKEVSVRNPSSLNYSNVLVRISLPQDVIDYSINDLREGQIVNGFLEYKISNLPGNSSKLLKIEYKTPKILKSVSERVIGLLYKKIEKRIVLRNPSSLSLNLEIPINVSNLDIGKIEENGKIKSANDFQVLDLDNDSKADLLKYETFLDGNETKEIKLELETHEINFAAILTVMACILLTISAIFILVIRAIRSIRRRKMLVFIETLKKLIEEGKMDPLIASELISRYYTKKSS